MQFNFEEISAMAGLPVKPRYLSFSMSCDKTGCKIRYNGKQYLFSSWADADKWIKKEGLK